MAEVVSTGMSHMCDNSTVSVKRKIEFSQAGQCAYIVR